MAARLKALRHVGGSSMRLRRRAAASCLTSRASRPRTGWRPVRPRASTIPAALPRCFVRRRFLVWAIAVSLYSGQRGLDRPAVADRNSVGPAGERRLGSEADELRLAHRRRGARTASSSARERDGLVVLDVASTPARRRRAARCPSARTPGRPSSPPSRTSAATRRASSTVAGGASSRLKATSGGRAATRTAPCSRGRARAGRSRARRPSSAPGAPQRRPRAAARERAVEVDGQAQLAEQVGGEQRLGARRAAPRRRRDGRPGRRRARRRAGASRAASRRSTRAMTSLAPASSAGASAPGAPASVKTDRWWSASAWTSSSRAPVEANAAPIASIAAASRPSDTFGIASNGPQSSAAGRALVTTCPPSLARPRAAPSSAERAGFCSSPSPSSPSSSSSWATRAPRRRGRTSSRPRTSSSSSNFPEASDGVGARVVGNRLFVTTTKDLVVYDVSDPPNPVRLGSLNANISFENEEVPTNGKVLGVSGQIGGCAPVGGTPELADNCLVIYDVSEAGGAGGRLDRAERRRPHAHVRLRLLLLLSAPRARSSTPATRTPRRSSSTPQGDSDRLAGADGRARPGLPPPERGATRHRHRGLPADPPREHARRGRRLDHQAGGPRRVPPRPAAARGPAVLLQRPGHATRSAASSTACAGRTRAPTSSSWPAARRTSRPAATTASASSRSSTPRGRRRRARGRRPTRSGRRTATTRTAPAAARPRSSAARRTGSRSTRRFKNGGLVALAEYEQGTRFMQVTPEGLIRQLGYALPIGGSTSARRTGARTAARSTTSTTRAGSTSCATRARSSCRDEQGNAERPAAGRPRRASSRCPRRAARSSDLERQSSTAHAAARRAQADDRLRRASPAAGQPALGRPPPAAAVHRSTCSGSRRAAASSTGASHRYRGSASTLRLPQQGAKPASTSPACGWSCPGTDDVRRVALRRRNGRWSARPDHYLRETCAFLRAFKLERTVFGGTQADPAADRLPAARPASTT